jgi:hypothetical protein
MPLYSAIAPIPPDAELPATGDVPFFTGEGPAACPHCGLLAQWAEHFTHAIDCPNDDIDPAPVASPRGWLFDEQGQPFLGEGPEACPHCGLVAAWAGLFEHAIGCPNLDIAPED